MPLTAPSSPSSRKQNHHRRGPSSGEITFGENYSSTATARKGATDDDDNDATTMNNTFQTARESHADYYKSDFSDYTGSEISEEEEEVLNDDVDAISRGAASQDEIARLFQLTVRMSTQIVSSTHRRKLRNYRNCFTGRVAVQWMLANKIRNNLQECVELGNTLVKHNMIVPLKRRGGFANRSFLYRYNFVDEKNVTTKPSSMRSAVENNSGLSTQRFVQLSVELGKMVEEMKNLASQTEDTKSGVRFLARETAANMERAEKIIIAIRTQLHWARSAVVALAIGVLLMVFHQRKMYMSAVEMSGFGEASVDYTFKFGMTAFVVSRTLEVTAIVALFAAIVSLFLQDGGEMLSNMFMDSSDLEKSNEETSLKMTGVGAWEEEEQGGEGTNNSSAKGGRYGVGGNGMSPSTSANPSLLERTSSVISVGNVSRRLSSKLRRSSTEPQLSAREATKTMPEDYASPPPSEEDVEFWKESRNGDVGVRLSPLSTFQRLVGSTVNERQKETGDVPLQRPFHFESELFSGKSVFFIRNVPSTPEEIFNGKARKIQICIQGKFKEPVPIDDLMFGQYMIRPMVNLPSRWLLALATRVCQAFGAKYTMALSSPSDARPFIRAPLILAAQTICVSKPGEEPDVTGAAIEDTSLLEYMPNDLGHAERRKFILKHLKQIKAAQLKKNSSSNLTDSVPKVPVFDTENVYTFCFWQAQIDFSKYICDLGVAQFNLSKIVDGQPMAANCKTRDGRLAFRFEMWHANIVEAARRAFDYGRHDNLEKALQYQGKKSFLSSPQPSMK
jgi:hypothetical protein